MRRRIFVLAFLASAFLASAFLASLAFSQQISTPTGLTQAYQAVPTTLTTGVGVSCRIMSVTFFNNTGSPITITFQTKDASPLPLPLSGSLAANTAVNFNVPAGLFVNGGFSVQASGSGAYYSVVWQNP